MAGNTDSKANQASKQIEWNSAIQGELLASFLPDKQWLLRQMIYIFL